MLSLVRWGLVPSWAKDPKLGDRLINARSETVATTNSYQNAFRKRRCIIPADAFYEWTSKDKLTRRSNRVEEMSVPRQPYLVHRRDGEPMAFAGLWEIWRDDPIADRDAPDAWLRTCTIITTRANDMLAPIHSRMPVMLSEPTWDSWLDPDEHRRRLRWSRCSCPRPTTGSRCIRSARGSTSPRTTTPSLVEPVEV